MISIYIRRVKNGHGFIVMDDCCQKVAEGAINGQHDWPEMLRIIATRFENERFRIAGVSKDEEK
jgi:hypothetical protein